MKVCSSTAFNTSFRRAESVQGPCDYYNSTIIVDMPGKPQRGILRPRVSGPDLELREGILKVLRDLRKEKSLWQVAEALGISEQTLSRYLNDKVYPPATLGGDILFRLCEAGYPIACRGKT